MKERTKKMIDNKIWDYLEDAPPFWLKAIISTAQEIHDEKIAILCNQENAVETPVEPVSLAEATTEPNGEMEAQNQR